ncbi:Uncharacterised protein [Klebsiella pneumoniae subsp. ozaenae]|uniref:Uncharacterized protein n=1 Tax=Klebsiella pneumoniae subsp. ozaenae TaxID=574 RepID=A0A378BN65_KLEPO|nr:Uncharacterised protein [Klebsiella pneumoniae subsp. ozaenae]
MLFTLKKIVGGLLLPLPALLLLDRYRDRAVMVQPLFSVPGSYA